MSSSGVVHDILSPFERMPLRSPAVKSRVPVSRVVSDILRGEGIDLNLFKRSKSSKPIQFLVCGLLSTGKSALINSLICERRAREYDPAEMADPLLPGTETMDRIEINVQGIRIIIWDTPGLQGDANEKEYFDTICTKFDEVDAILFCMDMTVSRWSPNRIAVTRQLTERCGEKLWNKAILVLTKANLIAVPPSQIGQERQYFKRRYDNYAKRFRTQLAEQAVSREIADCVPAVAAGYNDPAGEPESHRLWYISAKGKDSSDPQDFIPEIWLVCLERISRTSRDEFRLPIARPEEESAQENDTADHVKTEEGGEDLQNIRDLSKLYNIANDQVAECFEAIDKLLSQLIRELDEFIKTQAD